MSKISKQPTDGHLKDEIVNYLINDRKMECRHGVAPYWMYTFLDGKNEYRNITIWFTNNSNDNHLPANVEIHLPEGECIFNGCIFNIEDLKHILYLTTDCYVDGYIVIPKNK